MWFYLNTIIQIYLFFLLSSAIFIFIFLDVGVKIIGTPKVFQIKTKQR